MRIIETKVFLFDELSEEAKEIARDWYRESGPGYEWWDCVYEDATQCAELLGIVIDNIYFSGFWSQGDGACFEGSYSYVKGSVESIKSYAPLDTELHSIAARLQAAQKSQFYKLIATCKHRGHYYHSGCMAVEVCHSDNRYKDIGDSEDDIVGLLREFADWIYMRLEKEHDYLNSDESVDESIRANEYEFTENGKRV